MVVQISSAGSLIEGGGSEQNGETVVRLAKTIENEAEIPTGLLLDKAKALRKRGTADSGKGDVDDGTMPQEGPPGRAAAVATVRAALVYERLR